LRTFELELARGIVSFVVLMQAQIFVLVVLIEEYFR
jgi:hypothetical protein